MDGNPSKWWVILRQQTPPFLISQVEIILVTTIFVQSAKHRAMPVYPDPSKLRPSKIITQIEPPKLQRPQCETWTFCSSLIKFRMFLRAGFPRSVHKTFIPSLICKIIRKWQQNDRFWSNNNHSSTSLSSTVISTLSLSASSQLYFPLKKKSLW